MMSCKLYVIQADRFVKIGLSSNPRNRRKQIQTSNPIKLHTILELDFPNRKRARMLESELHYKFKDYKCSGGSEWFEIPFDRLKQEISKIDLTKFYDLRVHKENSFLPIELLRKNDIREATTIINNANKHNKELMAKIKEYKTINTKLKSELISFNKINNSYAVSFFVLFPVFLMFSFIYLLIEYT